jgi:general secretion pathway protein D
MTVPHLPSPAAASARHARPPFRLTELWRTARAGGTQAALALAAATLLGTVGLAQNDGGAAPSPAPANAPNNPQGNAGGANRQDGPPPIQQDGDFYIVSFSEDETTGLSLLDFVKNCERATGLNFVVTKDTVQLLKTSNVRMYGTKRIRKADFYSFFQIVMFINDFACVEVGPPPLRVIVIQSLAQGRGATTGISQKATYVAPDDLEDWKDRPATLITTVVNLPNSDARALANSLRALAGTNPNQNMLPAGINSLILTGFGSSVYELAQLLYLIDESSAIEEPTPPVFDRIPLQFAVAEDVQKIVDELLQASQQITEEALRAAEGQAQAPRPRQTTTAKILIEARTNSLVIMAMPDDMPSIKDLIARLDTDVLEPERNYHIYQLENVAAVDMAETLESFLEDARSVTALPGATGGTSRESSSSSSEDVVVVPEKVSNSLIIAANKTRYAEVVELIRSLDRRQDQVLIETALVELSSNDFIDIGVELGLANLPGADETGGFGVTSFGLSTLEDLDDDGVFDSRVPIQADGITAGIIDGDDFSLPFLLRLLRRRTNANVLSVPSILVNNNGEAEITIVDEIPFTQVTAFGGGGGQTQENFQGYEEAGIALTISPSISASRYLRLGVELEVSNFVGSPSASNIPPPRVTRTLKTTVNVPDGDTMVIGGVITSNQSQTRRSTPWLGDLPVIGALFRRDADTEDRRTLYFFVTPHILADKDFADLAEFSYGIKMKAADVIGSDKLRLVDPDFSTGETGDELQAFDIPLYRPTRGGESSMQDVGLTPDEREALLDANDEEAVPADAGGASSND